MRLAVSRPLAAGQAHLSLFPSGPPVPHPRPLPVARGASQTASHTAHTQISRSMPWGEGNDAKHASSPKPSLAGRDGPTAVPSAKHLPHTMSK